MSGSFPFTFEPSCDFFRQHRFAEHVRQHEPDESHDDVIGMFIYRRSYVTDKNIDDESISVFSIITSRSLTINSIQIEMFSLR